MVAVNHDTSILMLERTYSRYIGDHSDALARHALLFRRLVARQRFTMCKQDDDRPVRASSIQP